MTGSVVDPGSLSGADLAGLNTATPLDAALVYARLGWPVFPVAPVDRATGLCGCRDGADCEQVGKHPLVRWADQATTDETKIREWWRWKPLANIAVATGRRSGLVVVDLDRQHGGLATREDLAARGIVFPPTLAARTRSGGWHFFYSAPPDRRVSNTEGEIAGVGKTAGVDIRGDGGYIILAPSVRLAPHQTGTAPRQTATMPVLARYSWVDLAHPVAAAPDWVTAPRPTPKPGVSPSRPAKTRPARDPTARAAAALTAEIGRVRNAGEGGRNRALFFAAANLFEIVNTGHLDEHQVRAELTAAGRAVGLGEKEIAQTIDAQSRRKTGVTREGWAETAHRPQPPLPHLDATPRRPIL